MIAIGMGTWQWICKQVHIHVWVSCQHQHVAAACLEDLEQVIHGGVCSQEGQVADADVGDLCACLHVHQHQVLHQDQPHQVPPEATHCKLVHAHLPVMLTLQPIIVYVNSTKITGILHEPHEGHLNRMQMSH